MKVFWILLIIVALIFLNSKSLRQKVKSMFGSFFKSGSKKSSSNKRKKYEDEWDRTHTTNKTNYEKYTSSYNTMNDKQYLTKLYTEIKDDFVVDYYADKFIIKDSSIAAGYIFENGRIIKLYPTGRLEDSHNTKSINLSYTDVSNLMMFFSSLAQMAKRRPSDSSFRGGYDYYNSESYQRQRKTYSNGYNQTDTTKYTEEQLEYQEKFRKLKKNHDDRMNQLDKLGKKDPNRPALVNEVNAVKRKMKIYYDKSGLKKKRG